MVIRNIATNKSMSTKAMVQCVHEELWVTLGVPRGQLPHGDHGAAEEGEERPLEVRHCGRGVGGGAGGDARQHGQQGDDGRAHQIA